jgi:hypothetical protein
MESHATSTCTDSDDIRFELQVLGEHKENESECRARNQGSAREHHSTMSVYISSGHSVGSQTPNKTAVSCGSKKEKEIKTSSV